MSVVLLTVYLLNVNVSIAVVIDSDKDGLNNFNEVLNNTNSRYPDPNNHSSTPKDP